MDVARKELQWESEKRALALRKLKVRGGRWSTAVWKLRMDE
jgi:hypothetical protein